MMTIVRFASACSSAATERSKQASRAAVSDSVRHWVSAFAAG